LTGAAGAESRMLEMAYRGCDTPRLEWPGRSHALGVVATAAALMVIGLVMVASTSAGLNQSVADPRFWQGSFGRQAVFTLAAVATMLLVAHSGAHRLLAWRPGRWLQPVALLLLIAAGFLLVVLIPSIGTERNGARRWLQLGPADLGLGFQPSELAKPVLVLFLAAFFSGRQRSIRSFWGATLPAAAIIGVLAGLVGIEDFGTGALLAAVGGAMLLVAGVRWWHLVMMSLPGATALALLVWREPYRMKRLTTFCHIWDDPRGAGYHPIQSLVTIASGGFGGRGLGNGVQKYGYLPEARSDFIFSALCEEAGLIGGVVVVLLFLGLLWMGYRVVQTAVTPFVRLLAFGLTTMICVQAAMNIAVVTVWAPTKGISLPLVSAGGSGVLFLGVAIGLLASAAREAEWLEASSCGPVGDTTTGTQGALPVGA
jgi:cell division protein FtsW